MSSDAAQIPESQGVQSLGPNQTSSPNGADQIAHVLFLDVVGFTKLRPVKQRAVLEKLQDIVRGTEDFCAAKKKKQLIALPTGDGMALVFLTTMGGSGAALSCAEKIADSVLKHSLATNEDDAKINIRMGIHSGNVVKISDVNDRLNVAGEGINTAQRVMDCGDIGHILLSDKSFHFLPTEPDRTQQCMSLGEVAVKHDQKVLLYSFCHGQIGNPNPPEKIRLERQAAARFEEIKAKLQADERTRRRRHWALAICLFVILGALLAFLPRSFRQPDSPLSLAVLPLKPQIREKYSSRAISKGLTEDFIRGFQFLAGSQSPTPLRELKSTLNEDSPIPTESSQQTSAIEAGKRLGVRYILTGTVNSDLDDGSLNKLSDADPKLGVKLHVELRNTESGERVWSQDYTSTSFNQLISVEESVINEVSQKLNVRTTKTPDDDRRAKAHWCYLVGRFWAFQRTYAQGEDKNNFTQRAITKYQEAANLRSTPYYALALAGLADIHLSTGGVGKDPKEAGKEALATALEAAKAAQDPSEEAAELYAAVGTEKWWLERDFLSGIIAFKMAIKLNPNLADGHKRYSALLAALGKKEDAQQEMQLALDLEPASPIFQLTSGQNYVFAGDFDKAIDQLQKVTDDYPQMYDVAYRFLAIALDQKNRGSEALKKLEQVRREKPDSDFLSAQAHIQARLGQIDAASKTASDLVKLKEQNSDNSSDYVSPYNIAVIYAELSGKEDEALKWLKRATDEYDPRVTWLKVDPRFAKLRKTKEREFNERLQAAGLS